MSAHTCREYTPGCFRCDLNLDELDDGQLRESLRIARAEVAALREAARKDRGRLIGERDTAERDLAEARDLLAHVTERLAEWDEAGDWTDPKVTEARAFLRRDEARRCYCSLGNMYGHWPDEHVAPENTNTTARDEAQRCECPDQKDGIHDSQCERDLEAFDEASPRKTQVRHGSKGTHWCSVRGDGIWECERDEARWEPSDNVFTHDEARDEARRCTCRFNGSKTAAHEYDCPARDEADHE